MAKMGRFICVLLPLMFLDVLTSMAVSMNTMEAGNRSLSVWTHEVKGKTMSVAWNRISKAAVYRLTVSSEYGTIVYDDLTDTLLTLTGLSPETKYSLQLSAFVDGIQAESSILDQSTSSLQFNELPCKAIDPTQITNCSFVARWKPVANAEHYYVSVCERVADTTCTISFGFPNNDSEMPCGWSSSSKSLSHDYYGESGIFSLRLPKDRDSLLIVAQGDSLIKGLRFWWSGSHSGNALIVRELNADGHWFTVGILNTEEGKDSVANYSFDGAYAVSVSFKRRTAGYVCVDDVTTTVATSHDHPLPNMCALDAGDDCKLNVSGLRSGVQYTYRVYATAGGQRTAVSNPITLQTLTDPTAIAAVDVSRLSGPVRFYDLAGRRVNYSTAPSGIYIVRKGGNTYKVLKK